MKKGFSLIVPIVVLTLAAIAFFFFSSSKPKTESVSRITQDAGLSLENEPVEFRASFEIVTNGTKRTFSDKMYHNLFEDAFINADDPGVVVVKKPGITWRQFFDTLPFKLTYDCLTTGTGQTFCNNQTNSLRFILNGQEDVLALDKAINPSDHLRIEYAAN